MNPSAVSELHNRRQHDDHGQNPRYRRTLTNFKLAEGAREQKEGRRCNAVYRRIGLKNVDRLKCLQRGDHTDDDIVEQSR